jgi:hypothetical protein
MTFEFLIVYFQSAGVDITTTLKEKLGEVLGDNLNEVDEVQLDQFIVPLLRRACEIQADANEVESTRTILGFRLDLPDETANAETVIAEFGGILADTAPIIHVVKFDDPILLEKNQKYFIELFQLEMKLRRVLSLVYLHSYSDGFFDLLRDEMTQPMKKEPPTEEQMKKAAENQFFHLTFGQYVGLNTRRLPSNIPDMIDHLRESDSFESFKSELERSPVTDEADQLLLASLRDKLDPVEKLRNCVAHNRAVSERLAQDYVTAKPGLEAELDAYLQRYATANQNANGVELGNQDQQ